MGYDSSIPDASPSLPALLLKPRAPFNFAHTLRFLLSPPQLLNGRRFAPLLDYFEAGEYRRVAEVGGRLLLYGVREANPQGRPALEVRLLTGQADAAARSVLTAQIERQFSSRLDLLPFYELARADPVLARLVEHFQGMRIPQAPSVFETLVCAILEQQVNLSFAHQVKKALIEAYGGFVEFEGRRYNAFPQAAALAATTPSELRRLQISAPKARYLIGIARALLDGSLAVDSLRELAPAAAQAKLIEHKGVGPWTAHYVGLRALGHLDCLPSADVGLQKAIRDFYGLRQLPTASRVEKLARRWSGWRSYATFYLWLTYWESKASKAELIESIRAKLKTRSSSPPALPRRQGG